MLKEYTNNNYQKIEKEIDKLKMLKFDEKKITKAFHQAKQNLFQNGIC